MLREAQHLLALLCRETQLTCLGKRIDVGEAQEHIGLRCRHAPKLADVLLREHALCLETRRCLTRQVLIVPDAVIRILGEILDFHARCGDVVRLYAQNTLDDAVAFLPCLLPCTSNQFIRREGVHLARQIRILAQAPTEFGDNLCHPFNADLPSLSFHHAVQLKLHPFLFCHAMSLPLLVVPRYIIPCFNRKSYKNNRRQNHICRRLLCYFFLFFFSFLSFFEGFSCVLSCASAVFAFSVSIAARSASLSIPRERRISSS